MRIQHWFYTLPLRFRSLFHRRSVEQDLDEELQYHLEQKTAEFQAKGLPPRQSRQAALRAMDGFTQRQEECRDMWGVTAIENIIQDLRYALRVLAKSPGFTTVAVLTLALAIGANAVVFSVLNALILRPLDVPAAESLYNIEHASDKSPSQSYTDYIALRDRNRSFDGLAASNTLQVGLDTGQSPSRAWIEEVSGNYFDVLHLQPYLGRFIHASDEHGPNSAPYIVLTYAYWHTHFQDDSGVVGRVVRLNKHPFTIIGVAPRGFHGAVVFFSPDFFVPIVNQDAVEVDLTIGHLKAGVTTQQATSDLNSIGSYLEKTYPIADSNLSFALARPSLWGDSASGGVRAFLAGLMLLAGLILLAACANLGSLFAARASDRSREVALRLALGAGRARILRGLLTEALLISFLGGAVGLCGSVVLLGGLSVWQPIPRYPIQLAVNPDTQVYVVALLLTLASGFLFGAVPVRQVLRTDPYQIVKSGSRSTGGRRITVRDLLLVVQIAICGVLVTSSLVAVRGLARSLDSHFGFEPRDAILLDADLNMAGYRGDAVPAMQRRMVDTMQSIPGVMSVGLIDVQPLSADTHDVPVFTAETTDLRPSNAAALPATCSISPDYFHAAGTTLLAGRSFSWHDDKNAPRVAVINLEFARKVFGAATNALGRDYKLPDGTRIQVVGIVEDGKYKDITEDPRPAMFLPILQSPSSATTLVVRSRRDPRQLAAAMRKTLADLDAGLPSYIQTWNKQLDLALFPAHMATMSLSVLGVMGAILAVTGIFGMAAYSVSKRLKELGVRVALGAQRREVLQAALGRAAKLLALGSAAGLLMGILASRVLAFMVFQATPRDPLVLVGVVLVMLLLGLLATWIPAQRALSLDPVTLLREE